MALLSAGLLKQYQGTPLQSLLSSALAKVAELLPEKAALDLAAVRAAFIQAPSTTPRVDARLFREKLEAISQRRRIEIDYSCGRIEASLTCCLERAFFSYPSVRLPMAKKESQGAEDALD